MFTKASMNQLLHNDEPDPRKKFFHHESVSVPIDAPSRSGIVHTYDIPFGPPVIHAEPDKTLDAAQQQQRQFNQNANGFFFNIAGRSIVPDGFDFGDNDMGEDKEEMEDVEMEQ